MNIKMKVLMNKKGMSQHDLAKASGVGQPSISKMLKGESKRPRQATVKRLATALDWHGDPMDILKFEGEGFELPEGWTARQAQRVLECWPTWSNGEPCIFGDWFGYQGKEDRLTRLTIYSRDHEFPKGANTGHYTWNEFRAKDDGFRPDRLERPKTVEDLLQDFADEYEVTVRPEDIKALAELIKEAE